MSGANDEGDESDSWDEDLVVFENADRHADFMLPVTENLLVEQQR
ncbi:hypothetical protein QP759_01080 [Actinomycetaceae bacterium UMB8039B]|nr:MULTISPECIES: hypothetical protein [Actinomycetaceae]MDK7780209.1 hypothetical protein [Actinomycetaceae bacterium UMB8041B]MDK8293109.1 hypothetical protein [Actinomycetaceae bacterium UMB8039B]MDK8299523.1 hypothetical protein [Actinomycetaceae bacterium UMB1218B]MDK8608714.1 hypothetical protein [Actinomycetaceae bacterium UMB8041A]MDK6830550.1 hypothetical protein [Pauljensenia sp. UMB8040A]